MKPMGPIPAGFAAVDGELVVGGIKASALVEQAGQTQQGSGTGIAADAGINHDPSGLFSQQGRLGLFRGHAMGCRQAVAQRQDPGPRR